MSQPDLKKRTRMSAKNDADPLNKPKPKKGRGKATEKEKLNEDNAVSKDVIMASSETNVSSSLVDDIGVEDSGSKAQTSKKWTSEQRLQLIEAVLKHVKVPWDEVCNEVDGGKNGKMCYDQWRRKIVPGLKSFIKSENGN